ncbi:Integral membrane protein OS=Streptomyces tendae OX=1932 GN=F3L20_01630 PE=4 SV=1 [Streptomyces tendae]
MYPEQAPHVPAQRAVEVHQPTPYPSTVPAPAPVVPVQPGTVPAVASIVLPDGRVVTGYAINPAQPEPVAAKPAVSRTAVNVALGGAGFLAVCGGLILLTSFIAALTAFITQLIILAAVIFGGWIAVQIFSASGHRGGGTTVNIRKAVIKRNHFHG